jgi:hypothetical protein
MSESIRDNPNRRLSDGGVAVGDFADDPDNEYAMIDATIVRAHQHSAGARKKGASIKP